MDDFDELLARTSLGAPGIEELTAAVPTRIVDRAMAEARAERVKQDDRIIERMRIGIHVAAMVTVGTDGQTMAQSPTELDERLEVALAPTASEHDADGDDETDADDKSVQRATRHDVGLHELASLAKDGDQTALNALLARVRLVAYRYVWTRLEAYPGGADMVDDVAQEVCVAVFGALVRYRDEGRPFEAFVYGISARKVADAQRAFAVADLSTPNPPDTADDSPTPEEQAVRHDEAQHIVRLLDRLPEQLREILRLRVVAGMSAEETGRAVGMAPGAVRVAQHRALNTLRGIVGQEETLKPRGVDEPDVDRGTRPWH
jgi:RNA polymerase sigma-70 factor (ECF subfamily)